ncbi:MAG: hypothetical protein NVV62_09300 [Terricaulis sp.]|nr:hypothetical protein [Terricaulis sp.]
MTITIPPAYERDYSDARGGAYYEPPPQAQPQCTRRERQWDRYANRYVTIELPC